MRLSRSLLVASVLAVAVARPLSAQSITVGSPTSQNCWPFGCMLAGAMYQQVYAASLFGTSPLAISSLTFLTALNSPYVGQGQSFDLFLSTTETAVGDLSRNLASNVGSTPQLFATFTPSGTYTNSITIVGNTFVFDPTGGNLLLGVAVKSAGRTSQQFAADDFNGSSSRAFDPDGSGPAPPGFDDMSLVTVFGGGPVTTTPEPATLTMLATGLAGLAGAVRRRRRTLPD